MAGNWQQVGGTVKALRKQRGWTQQELSERSDVAVSVIRYTENVTGRYRPTYRTLEDLSAAFGRHPCYLSDILHGRIAAPATGTSPVPRGVLAVDPPGCGCTECLTGQYVPLERATDAQVADLLAGTVQNNTGLRFTLAVRVIPLFEEDNTPVAGNAPDTQAWHMIEDGWHLDTRLLTAGPATPDQT